MQWISVWGLTKVGPYLFAETKLLSALIFSESAVIFLRVFRFVCYSKHNFLMIVLG